jgi:DNA-binding LacI/PurR family transcriptional regulator
MTKTTRKPTIRDVAAEAGVSKSLVSLVFSSPESVSDKRKELVLQAAEKLGFAPNFLARSLAAETGTYVAILVADLHNPLFAEIADRIRIRLEEEGRHYFITSAMIRNEAGIPKLDRQTLRAIVDLKPESLLVIGSIPTVEALESLPSKLPIIIASGVPAGISRATTVRPNEEKGMKLIVDHLAGLGHKRISHIAGNTRVISTDRVSGYEKAMVENGLGKYIDVHTPASDDEIAGYEVAKQLLASKNPPTAIACYNDLIAIGAQAAILETKSHCSVTGYDNTYLCGLSQISLTSVDPGNHQIAEKCAELLLGGELKPNSVYFSQPELIERSSSRRLEK